MASIGVDWLKPARLRAGLEGADGAVEDAVAGAEHGLVGDLIGQADARHARSTPMPFQKFAVRRRRRRSRPPFTLKLAGAELRESGSWRSWRWPAPRSGSAWSPRKPSGRAVVALGHRRIVLDAQAEVEGQLAGDLPIVLDVRRRNTCPDCAKLPLRVALPPGMPSSSETSSPPTGGAGRVVERALAPGVAEAQDRRVVAPSGGR